MRRRTEERIVRLIQSELKVAANRRTLRPLTEFTLAQTLGGELVARKLNDDGMSITEHAFLTTGEVERIVAERLKNRRREGKRVEVQIRPARDLNEDEIARIAGYSQGRTRLTGPSHMTGQMKPSRRGVASGVLGGTARNRVAATRAYSDFPVSALDALDGIGRPIEVDGDTIAAIRKAGA